MTRTLYEGVLYGQLAPTGADLSDDAKEYLVKNLDMAYEDAARHVIRLTLVPTYQSTSGKQAEHVKDVLEWYLNCATEEQCDRFLAADPEWPVGYTDPPRLFFQWWWKELFGDEDWRSERLCDATLAMGDPPDELEDGFNWPPPIDPAVLHFPRRDGQPPGAGAPAEVNRPEAR